MHPLDGGGYSTRGLYTDDDEKLFDVRRGVILNGIEDVAERADLLDRAVVLHLPTVPEAERRAESDIDAEFERVAPRVFGALLAAVSSVLKNRSEVVLTKMPRMADFAVTAMAAEKGLGWEPGAFLKAYSANRVEAQWSVVQASPIGQPIMTLMDTRESWTGTPTELLTVLEGLREGTQDRFPRNPRALSGALKRVTPGLRAVGVLVGRQKAPNRRRDRQILLSWSVPPASDDADGREGRGGRYECNGSVNRPTANVIPGLPGLGADGTDGADGSATTSGASGAGVSDRQADDPPADTYIQTSQQGVPLPSEPSVPSAECPGDPDKGDRGGPLADGSGVDRTVATGANESLGGREALLSSSAENVGDEMVDDQLWGEL